MTTFEVGKKYQDGLHLTEDMITTCEFVSGGEHPTAVLVYPDGSINTVRLTNFHGRAIDDDEWEEYVPPKSVSKWYIAYKLNSSDDIIIYRTPFDTKIQAESVGSEWVDCTILAIKELTFKEGEDF